MVRHSLLIPGIGEITSGGGEPAIGQIRFQKRVNSQDRIAPGCVAPAVLQAQLFADPAVTHFVPGQRVELYTLLPDGQKRKEGSFYLDSAVWSGQRRCLLTARDALAWLDKDVSDFMNGLAAWPYRLGRLAELVCSHCGVTLTTTTFPWSDLLVGKATYYYVTGAQVMSWISAIAGRFCQATADGFVELAWYVPTGSRVGVASAPGKAKVEWMGGVLFVEAQDLRLAEGALTAPGATVSYLNKQLALSLPEHPAVYGCMEKGLHRRENPVAPPDGVRIGYSYAAMCSPYPAGGDVLTLTGNRLLKDMPPEQMTLLAASIYDQLKSYDYTPCLLQVSAEVDILPGQILYFSDGTGEYRTLVTAIERNGAVTEIKGGTL